MVRAERVSKQVRSKSRTLISGFSVAQAPQFGMVGFFVFARTSFRKIFEPEKRMLAALKPVMKESPECSNMLIDRESKENRVP
jgi:hypothetical protein